MKKILLPLLLLVVLSSCRMLNPSLMFKTPKHYQYAEMKDSSAHLEYKISANDVIEFRLFSNDGFKLTDVTASASTNSSTQIQTSGQTTNSYIVDIDGYAKLPVLGRTLLQGLTIREAEKMLEEKYSLYYVHPFILIKIDSKRVVIFPGAGGAGKVIPLEYSNTTLMEGLAIAGGITTDGKAYEIKLIRRTPGQKVAVYHIDLSNINGIAQGNIVLQANDIIYVEPRLRISQGIVNELAPILSILSSVLLVYVTVHTYH